MSDLKRVNDRIRRTETTMAELLEQRRLLYLEARRHRVRYSELAAVVGTTEAAVMQVVLKAQMVQLEEALKPRLGKAANGEATVIARRLLKQSRGDLDTALEAATSTPVATLRTP